MCEPTTILYVATALAATSAYQQSEARKEQGEYNAVIARNNAKMAEYQAEDAAQRGEVDAINARRKAAAIKGDQRATMAARGLDLGEGTALSLLDQTDYFSKVDQGTIRGNAAKEGYAKKAQAANFLTEATMYQNAADSESPLLSAAAAGASVYASGSMAAAGGTRGAAESTSLLSDGGTVSPKWMTDSGISSGWSSAKGSASAVRW